MYFGKSGHCIVPTDANIMSGQNAEKRDCPDEIGTVGNPGDSTSEAVSRRHCQAETRKTSRQTAETGGQDGVVLVFFLSVTLPMKIIN